MNSRDVHPAGRNPRPARTVIASTGDGCPACHHNEWLAHLCDDHYATGHDWLVALECQRCGWRASTACPTCYRPDPLARTHR